MSPPDRQTAADAEHADPTRRRPGVLIGRPWIRLVDAPEAAEPPHLAARDPAEPTRITPAADRAA